MSFRFLTAGESHGKALIGILEGIPSGLEVTAERIHEQLLRRKLGYGRSARQKMESDQVEILSGIRHGSTLGSPITLVIQNQDWKNWQKIMQPEPVQEQDSSSPHFARRLEIPRPGHADYVGGIKYAHEDMRNILERASARETAIRVGLGSIARFFLESLGVSIASRVTQIGPIPDPLPCEIPVSQLNARLDSTPLRVLDSAAQDQMIHLLDRTKKEGNTLGGTFEVLASGIPLGLGSHVQWDRRLDGQIAQALMSLNAIKGVELGEGFRLAELQGSDSHDAFFPSPDHPGKLYRADQKTNRSGGVDGGMTTGQTLVVRAAMKPLATLMSPLPSVHLRTGDPAPAHVERSDVCAVPAAAVIGESLLALVLAEAVLEKFGGDSMGEIQARIQNWNSYVQNSRSDQ